MAHKRFADRQDEFQRAVLSGDTAIVAHLGPGAHETRENLLNVYKTAYVARLEEIMSGDHEILHTYLGDEWFSSIARAYVAAHPSNHPNARWFSRHLPEFLEQHDAVKGRPYIADIAHLERALNNAFDCVDGPVATLDDLANIDPEDWANLCFEPHSSLVRLNFQTNAADIWLALKGEETPPEPKKLDQNIVVWRQGPTPMMRKLENDEAMMWDESRKGVSFGALCELLAFHDETDAAVRAANYLQGWLAGGLLSSAHVAKVS